jgi:hypothetical protein
MMTIAPIPKRDQKAGVSDAVLHDRIHAP